MWRERMTDSGGPQRHTLCFLSTLLSQKVPEKSDTVLRCIISGQPKPEVTWYKNGQAVDECGIISSYESFENQYIHMLHLFGCTQNDAAVYQVSAKNCFGMICCSASVEVKCSSENLQLSPPLKDDGDTGWKHETETSEQESTKQIDGKKHPYKEEDGLSSGPPMSADAPASKFNCLWSLQLSANNDVSASSPENPLDVKGTRQTEVAYDPNNTEEIADGLLFPNSSNIPDKQDVHCHRTVHSKVSRSMDGALNNHGPNDDVLICSPQNPKVQQYVSSSLPLLEAAVSVCSGDRSMINERLSPQVSSKDSDSDYELCPEITLTYTEEFSDDDLEYLECSDVMTDYFNAVWQRNLQGTEGVFLLESDDEEMEFSECCLGGCEHFLSEMGCGPRVSDDTGLMDATTGFCGYHSQPQEVGVRNSQASTPSPSSLQTGMTLTLGPHQDGMSTVTDQGRYKLPIASEAAENDYSGIQGETRDSHQGEEFASDNLLNVDKAVTETEMKRLSGELEKSGVNQCLETAAEKRVGGKDLLSKRGSEKPAKVRQPGIKGKPKKLNPNVKESATEDTLNLLYPKEPVKKHPLTRSDTRASAHAKAEATGLNSQFHAGECAISTEAEQEAKTLQTPRGSLPKEGNSPFEGEGVQVTSLFETSRVPDWSDHPQVQIQETIRERISLSRMPAFSEPAGEESAFTGTTTNSFPNLGGIHKENASLAHYVEVESCTRGPRHQENQDREDNAPVHSWENLGHELSIPKANNADMFPCERSAHLPQEGRAHPGKPELLSVASPEQANTTPTLETVCGVPRDREATCMRERLETGDQETCDTMDSPVGADKYLPQEICSMHLELAGQSKVSDLCSPDDKTLDVLFQTRGSEPPQSTCESSKDRDSAMSPLFISTFTWNISQRAGRGATGGNPAEVENSTSTGQAGQEGLSPSISGGLEERQPLSSENNSFVWFKEGGDESPSTSALHTADTPASHSSIVKFPQEKPTTLTAHLECLQVTKGSGDTSAVTIATKVHAVKYLPVSVAGKNHADGPEERSLQEPDEKIFQLPSSVQLGHILNGSTTEAPKVLLCMTPGGPGVHIHVPPLPEGEDFCSNSPLQIVNQSGEMGRTMDRADNRSLEENFQEKGSETTQRVQQESLPHQGSLSEDGFQESLPTTSAAQGEINPVPSGQSSANSREDRRQSSGLGTSMSAAADATVEDDTQALSNVPPLSNILQEESKESGPGLWDVGHKLKIITLEASFSEVWPPRQLTASECKKLEAVPTIADRVWAVSDVLKADVTMPELYPSEIAASAHHPRAGSSSALANNRGIHESEEPASHAHWSSLSSQYLSQPRLLESSVDPVGERELCVTDLLSDASKTGGKKNVNNVSQNQEENQLRMDRPAFFKQFLTHPKILESSVDPIDETDVMEYATAETAEPSESTVGVIREESKLNDGNMGQRVKVQPAVLQVPCPQQSEEAIPRENSINPNQEDRERGEAKQNHHDKAKVEVQPAILQAPCPDKGRETIPSGCSRSQIQEGSERGLGKAEQSKNNKAEFVFPTLPLSSSLAVMTHASVGVDTHNSTGQVHDIPEKDLVEPRNHQYAFYNSKERRALESECGNHVLSPSGLTWVPFTSSPEGNITNFSISHKIEKPKKEEAQIGETKPTSASGSPAVTLAFISGECASEKAPKRLQDPCQQGCTLGRGRKSREEKPSHMAAQTGRFPGAPPAVTGSEEVKKKQETSASGHLTEGVKKKILSRVAALRLRLEEKENVRKSSSLLKRTPKLETSVSCTDGKKDPKKPPCKREGKAPILLKKIQAEMFPDHSGNVKLSCQFAEIHEESTIWWMKDSKSIAQVQRSAGDNSTVSLAIVQASQKDQGLYYCCINNSYGKVTAEFNLTAEVLKQLSSHQDTKGCEEIEFSQLIFREDFLHDSYFGGRLHGQIATEELHFGEGVHRKAFRSKVMRGLLPVFEPGHACVLKVHNAVAYGTRNNDELVQRNYKLAAQECYVQNTARHYAKIYAAEAQPLEGFGEVPEIIPIFLIHRPENNIPYATVEEELIGEFVKYSIRDGKEINFLRRESEAGQKCCTFQHWVYQKTSGGLLVTDMQGVGMKLTDVGIATLAKGYKGFKGNCSMTFIDQFKALHQCNKYCKMLGLKSLQNNQKQRKPSIGKSKIQPNSTTVKKMASGTLAERKT
ncbi:PREDICTED: alpha-protein kinase 2 isoform X1 [Ceratotherium simum simum]|uniref:non-specific serine/threonine protein kinase n=2 Tax=Ceratotherium simum simum TaxID=73337 RepID=A0ABM0H9V8_CERSS|nr:PREDICTED: alpha-protein kinase 2 isoform X1 [Ceratotherium simum simum]